ncbi:hypothetical protein IJT10_01865 [bacterium]|nr:hypothetical protein [bacterium]
MSDPENTNNAEAIEEEAPEFLNNLIDELLVYAKYHGEHMEAEWIPEESLFRIYPNDQPEVDVFMIDIDDSMYHESEAVVVESEIGPMDEDIDPAELLRFCDRDFIYSRLMLSQGEDCEYVVLQAACPVSQIGAAQLDCMIREVSVFSEELSEEDGDEE